MMAQTSQLVHYPVKVKGRVPSGKGKHSNITSLTSPLRLPQQTFISKEMFCGNAAVMEPEPMRCRGKLLKVEVVAV
jgi:hypothetical protein